MLMGSLPLPPSLEDDAPDIASPSNAGRPPMRASLAIQLPDEEALGLWLAALRTLLAEREPPSPIGPAALMGSFGSPLNEVSLADASLAEGVLVPAVLEAIWQALIGRDEGLCTEGIFRLSAAEV